MDMRPPGETVPEASAARTTATVLIAAFNAGPFIDRAIQSALAQVGVDLEVLVIDDGSTDDTAAVVSQFCKADARVRYAALPQNGGPSVARNEGLRQARGEWIAVLDADDAFLPGRLKNLIEVARSSDADIAADNFRFYDLHADTLSDPALEVGSAEIITAHSFVARARPYSGEADFGLLKPIFRRMFLQRTGLTYDDQIRHGEDFLLILEALLAGGRYVLTREVGYLYTTRSSGRSRTRVDYSGQVRGAFSLSRERRIAKDPNLSRLLRARGRALARLAAEREFDAAWSSRDLKRLAEAALTNARVGREVLRRLRRRLAR